MFKAALVAAFLAASMPAAAGPFEDALAAAERRDYSEAMRLWRQLAETGNPNAQHNLAIMYFAGQGVLQDYAEAAKWWRRAAAQGQAGAQYNLGVTYAKGQGVPQDYVLAHMWFNLAAAQGDVFAAENRDKLAARMTPAQIAEAQRLARVWKPTPPK